jgi:hypothetical protein
MIINVCFRKKRGGNSNVFFKGKKGKEHCDLTLFESRATVGISKGIKGRGLKNLPFETILVNRENERSIYPHTN